MKGGLGLFFATVLIGIVLIAGVLFLTGFAPKAFGFTCERDTFDQVNNWIQKISQPAAGPFDDEFRVGDCVDYITEDEGIKFKSGDKTDFKDIGGTEVKFVTGGQKIFPRDKPYDVRIDPSQNTITILTGNEGT